MAAIRAHANWVSLLSSDRDGPTPRLAPAHRPALTTTLPAPAAFAAWQFVNGPLPQQPRRVGTPLRALFEGLWRARRGEYRVRYRIDDAESRVSVLDIDHHRDAYRS